MTTLDLGGIAGKVILDDSAFQRTYTRVIGQMRNFGAEAAKAASGVTDLDAAMTRTGKAGTAAAEGTTRAARASVAQAKAAAAAAKASLDSASAQDRVSAALAKVAGQDVRVQQATLRLIAAQARVAAVQADDAATTQQVAAAKASLIGAQRSLTRAQQLAAGTARGLIETEDAQTAAIERLEARMAALTGASDKQRAAALRQEAAQEKAAIAAGAGSAEYAKLAAAEASAASASATVAATSRSATREFAATAKSLGIMVGAFELAKKAIDLTKDAAAYQASMTRIRTLTGASADEIKNMSSALLGLSGKVAQAPDELATSLYHMESVGLSGKKALDAVTVAAKGAGIGSADLEDTTNALTSTIASGIIKNESYADAMSDLLTIVGSGDMKLSQFDESLSTGVLATLAGFGLSLRDVGAALALFGDNNIRGAHAATQLRMSVEALAAPIQGGAKALASIGLQTDTLAHDMEKGGLKPAIDDLSTHIKSAGITSKATGELLVQAFGKRAGTGINVLVREYDQGTTTLLKKYDDLEHASMTFGQRWTATTKTAAFQFKQFGDEAEAAGISLTQKLLPAGAATATFLAHTLSEGLHLAQGDLGKVALAAAAVWVAFKGYGLAKAAVTGLIGIVQRMYVSVAANLTATGTRWRLYTGEVTESQLQTQAASAATTAQIAADQAAQAEAQLAAMRTYQQVSAAEITAMEETTAAAQTAATDTAAAAEAAAVEVDVAGKSARLGWASLAGPLGLAAIGVMTLVSLFHKSSTASKEAKDAAQAYTDALKSGGGSADSGDVFGAIVKQLSDNHVPEKIDALNKSMSGTDLSAAQFAKAIQTGGKPLTSLQDRLQNVIDVNQRFVDAQDRLKAAAIGVPGALAKSGYDAAAVKKSQDAVSSASALLKDLNAQYGALTKAQVEEITNLKQFGTASVAVQDVARTTHLASKTAQDYAAMLGFVADKNGIVVGSSKQVTAAVSAVSKAYDTATQSGSALLDALKTFSGSEGTANDRAAIIGATLKAANGDALNYAAAINAASVANQGLVTGLQQAASQVGKNGISVGSLMGQIVNLKKGTIDYKNDAAAPLISGLQSMQTAAMNAAEAQYQHSKALLGGKAAADAAYRTYESNTKQALIDEAGKLGITKDQAKKLADQYFGMPKKVKTLIEQEGANPVVNVLNKIGKQLSHLTGVPWNIAVNVNTRNAQAKLSAIMSTIHSLGSKAQTAAGQLLYYSGVGGNASGKASGGGLPEGVSSVGERGAELAIKHGSDVQILSHAASMAFLARTGMKAPGFAGGTIDAEKIGGKTVYIYDGIRYASRNAAENARTRANSQDSTLRKTIGNNDAQKLLSSLGGSAASIRSAMSALSKDVNKIGGPKSLSAALSRDNKKLLADANRRAKIASKIKDAQSKLTDAVQTWGQERSGIKQTVLGGFSIGSAVPDAAGMLQQLSQVVANAKKFNTDIGTLQKRGLSKWVIQQLAEAGPAALPQADALVAATAGQLRAISRQYSALGRTGLSIGTSTADQLYGAGVSAARGLVKGLQSQQKQINKAMSGIADSLVAQIRKDLKIHSPSLVMRDLGAFTGQGFALGIADTVGHVSAQGGRLADAVTPMPGATGTGAATGRPIELNVYPRANQSEKEIGRIAGNQILFALRNG